MPKQKKKVLRKIKDTLIHQFNELKKEQEEADLKGYPQMQELLTACSDIQQAVRHINNAVNMGGE